MASAASDSKTDVYVLARDVSEQKRLDIQHIYLKRFVYDGRLFYDADGLLGPNSRILDAGTGTGAWLLDVATTLPSTAELHGIDISSEQFPSTDTPSNVHFSIASITNLPQQWTGHFDFIHQRFLINGLQAFEWPKALHNYLRVLRPGGHVLLMDFIPRPTALCGPSAKAIMDIHELVLSGAGMMFDCADCIPSMLLKAGFVNVRAEVKLAPAGAVLGKEGSEGSFVLGGAYQSMGGAFVRAGHVESMEAWTQLVENMKQEWEDTGGFYISYLIAIAEKPANTV